MSCKWAGSDHGRILRGRHLESCPAFGQYDLAAYVCAGCLPCPERHCRVCGYAHADGTCAECLATTREALHDIARMCDALPEEVQHRGVEGEAMMLLGPAADPEARGHLEASALVGRVDRRVIEGDHFKDCENPKCLGCIGALHPEVTLGTWDSVWRAELEHDEPTELFNLATTVDYLDRTMAYMATWPHAPFEDFARDLRRCAAHMEAVLHDGEQLDRGAPCMRCDVPLERTWGRDVTKDGWRCPKCRETSTEDQYRFAVKADYIAKAEWLSAEDMAVRFPTVKASTVRSWASDKRDRPALVRKTLRAERVVYSVEDVEREKSRVAA